MIQIELDAGNGTPLYHQIRDQIISLIEKGVLKAGNRLPATRELSSMLNVDRSTVYKAYRELWSLGYIDSRPGSYSTVRKRRSLVQNVKTDETTPEWLKSLPPLQDCFSIHFDSKNLRYDFRSFSPDPSVIPLDDFRRCYNDVLREKGSQLLGYGNPGGYEPLLGYIRDLMSTHRIEALKDELMITGGAQNAIDLIARSFAGEGWSVVIEEPGYSEAIELFHSHGAEVLPCPISAEGPDLFQLESLFRDRKPSFFFTIPNYQNPTGYTSSQANREGLLSLCDRYGIPLIEDGYSQDMRGTLLSIKSMDTNNMVIYIGTFSKVLFPGVRTGWIYADRLLIQRLKNLQYISRVSGNPSVQAALERFCRSGYYDLHMKRIHSLYQRRMHAALTALDRYFPAELGSYTRPAGGYYLWVTLSMSFPEEELVCDRLIREGIGVRPGCLSMVSPSPSPVFRLSVAQLDETGIKKGIQEMCRVLSELHKERRNG